MEKMIVTIEWEGNGPYQLKEIEELLAKHYKSRFYVRRLNIDQANKPEKIVYSPGEAAQVLGVGRSMIYSLIYQNQIPHIKYGSRYIIPRAALEKQLGGSFTPKEPDAVGRVEKAELISNADDAIKLYDVLRKRLTVLVDELKKNS